MKFHDLPEDFQAILAHLFDPGNPMGLSRRLPSSIGEVLLELVTKDLELPSLIHDETELLLYMKRKYNHVPTVNDYRIRFHFWLEYENSLAEDRDMKTVNIHSLVCDASLFRRLFFGLPYRAAFLLCRPAGYQSVVKETLSHGLYRMREILDLPERDEKGKLNVKLLELKAKIFAMMDMRVNGAPTQKIQQLNMNLSGDVSRGISGGDVKELIKKGDMDTIRRRISELEHRRKELEHNSAIPNPAIEAMEAVVIPANKK